KNDTFHKKYGLSPTNLRNHTNRANPQEKLRADAQNKAFRKSKIPSTLQHTHTQPCRNPTVRKHPILTCRSGERASTPLLLISVKNLDCF
ncbi:hypothetical protein, partial [Lepagella muris]|uniref:hypothetical protein n=1 Tax=Lepagella muris TaxID=3032870 RepID=UPI0023B85DE5